MWTRTFWPTFTGYASVEGKLLPLIRNWPPPSDSTWNASSTFGSGASAGSTMSTP